MSHQPDQPVAGFYKMRLVRGGPFVAVRVFFEASRDPATGDVCDRSPRWQASIDGREADIWRAWPYCSGRPIDQAEYDYLLAVSAHARKHDPSMPEAVPGKPIDMNKLKPIF